MKPSDPVTNEQLAALQRTLNELFNGYYALIFSRNGVGTELLSQEMSKPWLAKWLREISEAMDKGEVDVGVLNGPNTGMS